MEALSIIPLMKKTLDGIRESDAEELATVPSEDILDLVAPFIRPDAVRNFLIKVIDRLKTGGNHHEKEPDEWELRERTFYSGGHAKYQIHEVEYRNGAKRIEVASYGPGDTVFRLQLESDGLKRMSGNPLMETMIDVWKSDYNQNFANNQEWRYK